MTARNEQILQDCERLGVDEVRARLGRSEYGSTQDRDYLFVSTWLESKSSERLDGKIEEQILLAREANSIARSAESTAKSALRMAERESFIAIVAAIAAVVAAIVSIILLYRP